MHITVEPDRGLLFEDMGVAYECYTNRQTLAYPMSSVPTVSAIGSRSQKLESIWEWDVDRGYGEDPA